MSDANATSITAAEFLRRIETGEAVSGCLVTEPVVLIGDGQQSGWIRTLNWRHCVFMYGVNLRFCVLGAPEDARQQFDLSSISVQGELQIESCFAINGDLAVRLDRSQIAGDVSLVAASTQTMHVILNDARVGGNVRISEPLTHNRDGEILQQGYIHQIQAGNLRADGDLTINVPANIRTALVLLHARIEGAARLYGVFQYVSAAYSKINGAVQVGNLTQAEADPLPAVFVDFSESVIGASLFVETKGEQPITVHLYSANVSGNVRLFGQLKGANADATVFANSAHIDGSLEIDVAPIRTLATERGRRIELIHAVIDGALSIGPQSALRSDGSNTLAADHCFEVLAWGLRTGGDVAIRSDHRLGAPSRENVELRVLALDGARIGGDLDVRYVRFTSLSRWSYGTSTVSMRHAHAGAAQFVHCTVDIGRSPFLDGENGMEVLTADSTALHGGQFLVFDFRFGNFADQLLWKRVRGSVWTLEPLMPSSVAMVSLDEAEMTSVSFERSRIRDRRPMATEKVLPIAARDSDIRGSFQLRPGVRQADDRAPVAVLRSKLVPLTDLSNATIGNLQLTDPPPVKMLDLRGARIGGWKIAGEAHRQVESAETYLRLLATMREFDSSIYSNIEKRLEEVGKKYDADQILVRRRQLEQQRYAKERRYVQWFGTALHGLTLRYGTAVYIPMLILAMAFAVGVTASFANYGRWYQLSSETLAQLNECGAPCGSRLQNLQADYSVAASGANMDFAGKWRKLAQVSGLTTANLTPMLDLQVGRELSPKGMTGGSVLAFIHKLLGWLLWPILISVALSKLLHSRSRT